MVALYLGGKRVESMADIEKYCSEFLSTRSPMDIRDDSGTILGKFIPDQEVICPWEPTLDQAEIDRRKKGKRYTTKEVLARLGEQ